MGNIPKYLFICLLAMCFALVSCSHMLRIYLVNDLSSDMVYRSEKIHEPGLSGIMPAPEPNCCYKTIKPGDSLQLGESNSGESFDTVVSKRIFDGNLTIRHNDNTISLAGNSLIFDFIDARLKKKNQKLILFASSCFKFKD